MSELTGFLVTVAADRSQKITKEDIERAIKMIRGVQTVTEINSAGKIDLKSL